MSNERPVNPRRRQVLTGVGAGLVTLGTGVGGVSGDQHGGPSVSITIDNVGVSAWEVTAVDGDQEVAPTGTENPTLTLQVGTRYTFQNEGWSSHPLAFRDADDQALLSQSSDGAYADDDSVNWVDDGSTVAFTLTESLAADLDDYICTVHSPMNGGVETVQPSPTATVSFSDQSTIGTSVVVDSVQMSAGGFVTVHDDTLQDGQVLESVRGVSEYLGEGEHQDVVVELDSPPLANGTTLISMPHRDEPADEQYRFVESQGSEDPPYTAEGNAVTDDADVQVDGDAAVQMSDQTSDGNSVVVDFLRIADGGFLTIHDERLLDGQPLESVIGVSDPLDGGVYENVEVTLDDPLTEDQTLIPMPHRDDPSDGEYRFVESQGSEDPPYQDLSGDAVIDQAQVTVSEQVEAELTFPDQATASSTFIQDAPVAPGVVVRGVSASVDSAVVVTYEDGGDLVVAGLDTFGADEFDEANLTIPIEDTGGFPGEHVAHIIPADQLSGEYAPGDVVSEATASAVVTNEAATVYQGEITFESQTVDGPIEEGDTLAELDASLVGGDAAYTVDVHVTNDEGSIVADEWAGSTDVISGENSGVGVVAERVPADGQFNEFPIEGTDSYIAMIHVANDDSQPGDSASPGSFPVLPHLSAGGTIPAGVTAAAEVTAEVDDGMDDGDDGGMGDDGTGDGTGDGDDGGMDDGSDDGMDDGGMDDGDNETGDDGGPGFTAGAGVAGLGGLAAYALKKLRGDPPTATEDDLEESDDEE